MACHVPILGLDPYSVPGIEPAPVAEALAQAEQRFAGTGLDGEDRPAA